MRKILTCMMLLALLFMPCQVSGKRLTVAERISTHSVGVVIPALGATVGSGTLVELDGKYAVITAAHVARGVSPMPVVFCSFNGGCTNGMYTNYISGGEETVDDWAIYYLDELPPGGSPAKISLGETRLGDKVWLSGVSEGIDRLIFRADVAWIEDHNPKMLYKILGYAMPGFSGGGVYDSKGRLTAITVAIRVSSAGTLQEDVVIAVPLENILYSS